MVFGTLLMVACVTINLLGISHIHFLAALFLLGVGWNFMFISATQMVTQSYQPAEKAKSQATNEFLVFSMVTISALGAGWLEAKIGWRSLNLASLAPLLITLILLLIRQFQIHKLQNRETSH
jgi:MFS family permease